MTTHADWRVGFQSATRFTLGFILSAATLKAGTLNVLALPSPVSIDSTIYPVGGSTSNFNDYRIDNLEKEAGLEQFG